MRPTSKAARLGRRKRTGFMYRAYEASATASSLCADLPMRALAQHRSHRALQGDARPRVVSEGKLVAPGKVVHSKPGTKYGNIPRISNRAHAISDWAPYEIA